MRPRDEVESLLRSWDLHERNRGAPAIVDYDFFPQNIAVEAAASRLDVLQRLAEMCRLVDAAEHPMVAGRLTAARAYLRALMGERQPLSTYVEQTQGCAASGWPPDYVSGVGDATRLRLARVGIGWDSSTIERLEKLEGPLTVEDVPGAIRRAASEFEPTVRDLVGSTAPFTLAIETVNVDSYWSYWLDGSGSNARLRLNLREAHFTEVLARQFALHEVLGHALQGASLAARAANSDVPWVRLLSVFAPQQVLFEGLAQTLPLFVAPEDELLNVRVRLAHYLQLVRAELHLAVNAGAAVENCAMHARSRVPFWDDAAIADLLSDRAVDPLLRTYLWSYSAGVEWFVSLADQEPTLAPGILRAAYRDPLTPADLEAMWPSGPRIGGPGGSVHIGSSQLALHDVR